MPFKIQQVQHRHLLTRLQLPVQERRADRSKPKLSHGTEQFPRSPDEVAENARKQNREGTAYAIKRGRHNI
ncbi:MAG: hypothetical protein WA830_22230 [Candidatus Sulfotelmatobacter sp.]